MNPQEREKLNVFLQQLVQVQAGQKDSEADVLIHEACARQPAASYLLVQRAMQLEHALESVKTECGQLQSELDKIRAGTQSGFLSDPNAWGSSAVTSTVPTATPAIAAGSNVGPIAQGPVAVPAAPAPSAWGSGILGTVATTAAGVVAGSFLYHGVSSLMGHHDRSGDTGLHKSANAASPLADKGVIENYFGDDGTGNKTDLADAGNGFGGDDMT